MHFFILNMRLMDQSHLEQKVILSSDFSFSLSAHLFHTVAIKITRIDYMIMSFEQIFYHIIVKLLSFIFKIVIHSVDFLLILKVYFLSCSWFIIYLSAYLIIFNVFL